MNPLHGLYAITDTTLIPPHTLIHAVEQSLKAGARIVQYRDKGHDNARRLDEATQLAHLCQHYSVPLIINDDIELVVRSGAAGVHLGRDDGTIAHARHQLGSQAIIGLSCYNEWPRAVAAQQQGADYIAFGAFFSSTTKPLAKPADAGLLRRAKQELTLPVAAIGGITPERGALLIANGADMLAVVHGLFGQKEIYSAGQRYSELFYN